VTSEALNDIDHSACAADKIYKFADDIKIYRTVISADISGLQGLQYNKRLKRLGLMRLERRSVRTDLIETFKIMN